MGMPPHKACCGCCCKLVIGAPVGAGLLLLLYILQVVLAVIGRARGPSAKYHVNAANAFCSQTTAEYRIGYNECYGSDVCAISDMTSGYSKAHAADMMYFFGQILAVAVLAYNVAATLVKAEQGLLAAHNSWKLLLFFPFWFFLSAVVNAALASEEIQFDTAVNFYERAAADNFCNAASNPRIAAGTASLHPYVEGFNEGDLKVICSEHTTVGVPDSSDKEGRGWMGSVCEPDGMVTMLMLFGFAWTIVMHIILVVFVIFNVYSLGCQIKDKAQGQAGTQMGASTAGQPAIAVATAVAVPAVAVATAAAVASPEPVSV